METPEEIMDFVDCLRKRQRFRFDGIETSPLMQLEVRKSRNDNQPGYPDCRIGRPLKYFVPELELVRDYSCDL